MKHCRVDYDSIQPWPTKRPHHGLVDEAEDSNVKYLNLTEDALEQLGDSVKPIIPDDEPVFLLRAKDITAPAVVRVWAMMAEMMGADWQLVSRVNRFADEMQEYANEHYSGGKTPDVPGDMLREVGDLG